MKMRKFALAAVLTVCMLGGTQTVCFAENKGTTEEMTAQIETLESENSKLKEQVEELESENAELKEQIATLKDQEEQETEEVSTEVVGTTYTDQTTTKIVQEALNKKGFDCGTPDGVAGSKTAEAIKSYQKENKINVNGVITDELLESLGVADQIDEAAKKEAQKAEYSGDYTYEQLARNPETYIGKKVKFSGKVLQAETGDTCYMRVAINSDYDTVLFVTYTTDVVSYRLLEDDYVTIYGTCYSTYSYKAVSGATITLPWIDADIIDLQ